MFIVTIRIFSNITFKWKILWLKSEWKTVQDNFILSKQIGVLLIIIQNLVYSISNKSLIFLIFILIFTIQT